MAEGVRNVVEGQVEWPHPYDSPRDSSDSRKHFTLQMLDNPPAEVSKPRPLSTALPLSEEPELLPQFCQRYGISQDMIGESNTVKPLTKGSPEEDKRPNKGQAVVHSLYLYLNT